MSNANRKKIIKRLRAEGYQAAKDGKHRQQCPYDKPGYPNWMQWQTGYDQFVREQQENSTTQGEVK